MMGVSVLLTVVLFGWFVLLLPSAIKPTGVEIQYNALYLCDPSAPTPHAETEYEVLSSIVQTNSIFVCSDVTNLTPGKSIAITILLFREQEFANIAYVDQLLDIEQGTFITPLEGLSLTEGTYRIESRKGTERMAEAFFTVSR